RRCAKQGQALDKTFSKVTTPSNAENALDDVVDREVMAAVIDLAALDSYKENKPGRAGKLKVLMQSEPFPCGIVAHNPRTLADMTIQRIRDGLMNAGKWPQGKNFMEMARIKKFEPVPDPYDQLFKDVAKAYPPPAQK